MAIKIIINITANCQQFELWSHLHTLHRRRPLASTMLQKQRSRTALNGATLFLPQKCGNFPTLLKQ